MKFHARVTVDVSGILDSVTNRMGKGSQGQYEWSKIVFDGSSDYVPFKEGNFFEHSRAASEPLFAQGELLYEAPPELDYKYLPMWLWTGQSRSGARIIKNYTTSTHANAGGFWNNRAKSDLLPVWTQEFQEKIKSGEV